MSLKFLSLSKVSIKLATYPTVSATNRDVRRIRVKQGRAGRVRGEIKRCFRGSIGRSTWGTLRDSQLLLLLTQTPLGWLAAARGVSAARHNRRNWEIRGERYIMLMLGMRMGMGMRMRMRMMQWIMMIIQMGMMMIALAVAVAVAVGNAVCCCRCGCCCRCCGNNLLLQLRLETLWRRWRCCCLRMRRLWRLCVCRLIRLAEKHFNAGNCNCCCCCDCNSCCCFLSFDASSIWG